MKNLLAAIPFTHRSSISFALACQLSAAECRNTYHGLWRHWDIRHIEVDVQLDVAEENTACVVCPWWCRAEQSDRFPRSSFGTDRLTWSFAERKHSRILYKVLQLATVSIEYLASIDGQLLFCWLGYLWRFQCSTTKTLQDLSTGKFSELHQQVTAFVKLLGMSPSLRHLTFSRQQLGWDDTGAWE